MVDFTVSIQPHWTESGRVGAITSSTLLMEGMIRVEGAVMLLQEASVRFKF